MGDLWGGRGTFNNSMHVKPSMKMHWVRHGNLLGTHPQVFSSLFESDCSAGANI